MRGRRFEMSTISHPPSAADRSHWSARVFVTEMWASLAIFAMWLAVAVSAVWGPDFVSSDGGGTNQTTIPSAVAVSVFAAFGTWAVAKYGFGRRTDDAG
jgi:hypothetical protein